MIIKTAKRVVSFALAFIIAMSMIVTQPFASAFDLSAIGIEEGDSAWKVLIEMNSILVRYLGSNILTEVEIIETVNNMDSDTVENALDDIENLKKTVDSLSDSDREKILDTDSAKAIDIFLASLESVLNPVLRTASVNSVLDGKILIIDSQNTGSVSGNSATLTVKSGLFAAKTNTVDIYNNTDKISTLKFNYSVSNHSSFTLNNTSGVYSVLLYPDAYITLTFEAGAGSKTATLKLTNFELIPAADNSDITFDFDSSLGSVKVNNSVVSAGSSVNITLANGGDLVAIPANGAKFIGWVDPATNLIYSTSASYKFTPVSDSTVKAVFVGKSSVAYFVTNDCKYLFDDLNNAVSYANTSGDNLIVPINDGILSAGNYTIPSGKTLLIPFDSANTIYTDSPESVYEVRTNPTAFRTLTMANGANLTVNGTLCLPAKHFSALGSKANGGSPDGPCSFIKMESGSNITVNKGGKLYAYGFITGSGKITAKSGSSVYEYFQIMDFRGGTQTSDMKNGVFPLSQYYVQNIEVPMTLEAGATENSYTSVRMSNMTLGSGIAFIANKDAMFNLSSGSVTKRYDPMTDRLIVDVNGTLSISPIEMQIGSGILSTKIDSKKYELPINGNITVNIKSGSITVAQDIAMLPGAEINIGENATCILGSGTNIYVYDASEWGGFCAPSNKKFIPVQYAPGRKYNRTDADIKDATIKVDGVMDASAGYIYTTKSGANIFSTGKGVAVLRKGTQTVTYQLVQNTGYSEIPLTSAKLKNADGTYFTPSTDNSTNYFVNGKWIEHKTHVYTETLISTADCENKGIVKFECPCGNSYTQESPALGHKPGPDATCTSNQTCTVCGKELNASKGHNYQISITEPTCITGGFTTHTCLTCGDTFTDNQTSAKGHTAGTQATCTENQICTVCGEVLVASNGHNYISIITNPDCTHNGYTTHTCSVCGDAYTDTYTEMLGHTAGPDATCTEPQVCITCGEILKSENGHTAGAPATCTDAQICIVCNTELSPALGHNIIENNAQDATCTEDGYSSGSYCTRCDYTEGKHIIPAKGHSPNADVTCTRNQVCTECGILLKKAVGHNYQVTVYLPTCIQNGYTFHNCLNCGDFYADSEVPATGHKSTGKVSCDVAEICTDCGAEISPAKGHNPGEEATCSSAQTCTDCGFVLVPAKGHINGARATCLTAQVCTVCNEETVPALGHKFKEKVNAATCTENGSTVYTCSRCRYKYIDNEVAATGHNMSDATCTEPSKCLNNCGHIEGIPLGHTVVIDEEMPAFCTQDGFTEGSHCGVCGTIIKPQEIIPALGHNLEYFDAKNPTYTSVGWEAYEDCTRCVYTTYVEIPMLEAEAIEDYESFIHNLAILEELAYYYSMEVPGVDPLELVIKYIRTGVDRYNEGSWGIMAGYENKGFAEFVAKIEDDMNATVVNPEEFITVSALKNIEMFIIPNGELVDFGHMFGTMDITYFNKKSMNHADVGGWAGDICDLIEFSDYGDVNGSFEEMLSDVSANYLLQDDPEEVGGFNQQDMYGDLDSYYIMRTLLASTYEQGNLSALFENYYTPELTMETRADYFLKNRLGGVSLRGNVRDEVYNLYTGNKLLATLEGTKEFKRDDVSELRKVCCYAFADYICKLAGDYVEVTENPYYSVFSTETSTLAPGIIQNIKKATTADNKQMVYYIATADLSRDDVHIYANYKDNDPTKWGMQTVLAQATAAQKKYGNPESEFYIENYNVIASINGDGYNMGTGEPGGLLIMDGKEYHGIDAGGFFGILNDGSAVIGTQHEYNTIYKDKVKEGIGGFGITLIKDGEIAVNSTSNYFKDRASRTAVGITRTGKVVFMVLDGRQEPISCGGDAFEIAQIMFEAGCVNAINLDGGGSTTYVAKLEGADEIAVVSKPSDGTSRSVSTSLLMVSTAPSSTAFDHAIIDSKTDYLTKGSTVQLIPSGVSATGNSAEIPEGTTWAVSDERWGSISSDGLFTGLRNGSVEVYLMLDDQMLGSKVMNIVVPEVVYFKKANLDDPDRVYFSKTNLNATYGEPMTLPVVALYENKTVTIQSTDVVFSLSNPVAGYVDGFDFTGVENSGVKNVTVTASLAVNSDAKASVNISLYNKGEVSFDFDNATGGNRMLAWNREVSNSTSDDNVTYEIVNTDEQMVTSYTFAIDMTQIPVPDQLADLTTMLPGAELENASAWNFLLQLAERVSVLTEVKPTVKIDPNFDVDYSKLTIVNECFELKDVELDEETNTLILTLKWKDQTQSIDPETANPHCILSGIKITPKEGVEWPKDKLSVVNSGLINYKVYMRATALYNFSNNLENQKIYGLYPFINPDDPNEKGGYFENVYAQFEDTYTLSKSVKEGWVNEEGGFAYYKDGIRFTGINLIDGLYYDFGENGINIGQTAYTGLFYDYDSGVYRYSKFGTLASGWQMIGEDWHYFRSSTMSAQAGHYKSGAVYYDFDETGKVLSGVWADTLNGTRYYYGPSYHFKGWYNIDGADYFFYDGYRYEGLKAVRTSSNPTYWYDFGEDGKCKGKLDGIYYIDGKYRYIVDGSATEKHLFKYGDDYYYSIYDGVIIQNETRSTASTSCDLPNGTYTFGSDGKMLGSSETGEIVIIDGVYYYYERGLGVEKGLVKCGDDYYFAEYKGKVAVNRTVNAYMTSCDLPAKVRYEFGADGKMLNGIVEKDGELYYYENGQGIEKGLVKYDGNYYFAEYKGKLAVNKSLKAYMTSCDLPANVRYDFGSDGKMLDGIVEKDGELYYYENGQGIEKGLIKYNGYYYCAEYNGKLAVNKTVSPQISNCDLPAKVRYEFGADGKILNGIIEKDGELYYYENGQGVEKGLVKYDSNYYFTEYKGKVVVNKTLKAYMTSCDLPANVRYEFGADGKMLHGIVEKDGELYYYENGQGVEKGLVKYDGDYYFTEYKGKIVVNKTIKAYMTSCDLPANVRYEFGADGKMLNGIVEKEGILYYYENGQGVEKGLFCLDGYYYYSLYKGELVVNQTYRIHLSNNLLVIDDYVFNEYGQIVG